MDQYSNLNVHGKIKQKTAQGTESDDVVLYPTLTNVASGKADKDLENIEIAGTRADGKTIVWDATNEQWEYGEAGKVDAVQINGTPIAGEGAQTKVANIPKAASDTLGVVKIGTNISIDSNGVISTPSVSATDSGSGNLVTGVSASGHALTVTKGISYGTNATQGNIVQRGNGGQITVPSTPVADTDAASKAFVNSSVGTNTATFRGTYNAVSDLGNTQATVDAWEDPPTSTIETLVARQIATKLSSLSITPTNNDYTFVSVDQTPVGDLGEDWYWRFKYNGSAWVYEYTLNNSSFTQAQWDAVNSGITADKVSKLDGIEAGAQVNTVTGVKGNSESTYRTGNINITKTNIGLGNVENTALSTKVVASTGSTSTPVYIDSNGVTQAVTSVSTSLVATATPSTGGTGGSNGLMTAADKEKLNSIASGAEVNVQADWNQTNTGADDYIKNKPELSVATTGSGNAVTAIAVDSTDKHKLNITKGSTFLTSHQTIKQDGVTGATVNRFGTCSTAASTAAKTVNISFGTFSLEAGATVSVSFTNDNTANSPTLSVDSTTAKYIVIDGVSLSTTTGTAYLLKGTCTFVYDGTYWRFIGANNAYHKEDTSGQHALALSSAGPSSQSTETGLDYYDRKLYYSRAGGLNLVNASNSATKAVIMSDDIYITNGTSSVSMSLAGGFMGNLTGNVTGNCSGSAGSVAYSGITNNPFSASEVEFINWPVE